MTEYRVTFGQKYRTRPHPVVPYAHPDGWITVEAADYDEARTTVVAMIGSSWAGMYDMAQPGPDVDWSTQFPRGELARIHPDRSVTVADPYAELARVRGENEALRSSVASLMEGAAKIRDRHENLRKALELIAAVGPPVAGRAVITGKGAREIARRALGVRS